MGLKIRNVPSLPSARAIRRRTEDDHIDAVTRPVAPPGKARSTTILRSMPGARSRAVAAATSGSVPASVRAQWMA
jgi:hypothetical protein